MEFKNTVSDIFYETYPAISVVIFDYHSHQCVFVVVFNTKRKFQALTKNSLKHFYFSSQILCKVFLVVAIFFPLPSFVFSVEPLLTAALF